jgi:dihydroorotate dehydrogenase
MASLRLIHRSIRLNHPHVSRNFASTTSHTRTYAYVAVFALTAGVGVTYYLDSRAAVHRYLITPIIRHTFDPETGHKLAVSVLESGLGPRDMLTDNERLKTEVKARFHAGTDLPTVPAALGSNIVESYRSRSGL